MKPRDLHDSFLFSFVSKLEAINESRKTIESILIEPVWMREDVMDQITLCDLILLYQDGSFRPLELKHREHQYRKATYQIKSGYRYGFEVLKREIAHPGKVVFYSGNRIRYKEVPLLKYV